MKRGRFLPLTLVLLLSAACAGTSGDDTPERVDEMYRRQVTILQAYNESVAHVSDAAHVAHLLDRLDSALFKVSSDYPANINTSLTADQNEILYKLTLKVLKRANRVLTPRVVDSLQNDTTSPRIP